MCVCVYERENNRAGECVCQVCVRACARVCVCVCVRERDREREREGVFVCVKRGLRMWSVLIFLIEVHTSEEDCNLMCRLLLTRISRCFHTKDNQE